MNLTEQIPGRRSVRTFDGSPLREEDAAAVLAFAEKADNPFGLPIEWKLLDRNRDRLSSPVITGADTFIAGKLRRGPHAEEAFGFSFEKVVLFAASRGVGTTWIAGTMDRKAFERAMNVSGDEVMPCVSPLGYPAAKMSLREGMMRRGVGADKRLDFAKLFFAESFARPLAPAEAGDLRAALEAVRLAPSAVNGQPWRVVLRGNTAHFYEKRGRGMSSDNWDIQKIDMGIALCHFELAATEAGLRPALKTEDPSLPDAEGLVYIASYVLE